MNVHYTTILLKKNGDGTPFNLRGQVGDLSELKLTLEAARVQLGHGVRRPLDVVDNGDGTYTLVDGHRRFAAVASLRESAEAELKERMAQGHEHNMLLIPAIQNDIEHWSYLPIRIVEDVASDRQMAIEMATATVQKELDPVSRGHALRRIMNEQHVSLKDAAALMGMSEGKARTCLMATEAAPSVQQALRDGSMKITTYDKKLKNLPKARQERVMKDLGDADATGERVKDVLDKQNAALGTQATLFPDADVVPTLNEAKAKIKAALDKRLVWSSTTEIQVESILHEILELVGEEVTV